MIRHLFKLIWNQKRKNMLIIIEIFFCFLVIFWVVCTATYSLKNYAVPLGYNVDQVYLLSVGFKNVPEDKAKATMEQVRQKLKAMPQIKGISTSPTIPFLSWGSMQDVESDNQKGQVLRWAADDDFAAVFDVKLLNGRWFDKRDNASTLPPAIITEDMQREYFKGAAALGKTFMANDRRYTVIGICANVRNEVFSTSTPGFFQRVSSDSGPVGTFMLRINSGNMDVMSDKMILQTSALVKSGEGNWYVDGVELSTLLKNQIRGFYTILLIIGIVCLFLILNVVLGLWGVLWLSISKRSPEIGLRRAIGAVKANIQQQFLGEAVVLATMGVVPGVLLAIQFPLLNVLPGVSLSVYLLSILISILLVYMLVLVCAFYPSWKASKVQPALVLHEN